MATRIDHHAATTPTHAAHTHGTHASHEVNPHPPGGRMGVHGMVLFGNDPFFASHIPMLHPPHDVQLIMQIELDGPKTPLGDELFTFKPDAFPLDDLRAGRIDTFKGALYEGNFEQPGAVRLRAATAKVKLIKSDVSLSADTPASEKLSYVLAGSGTDTYLVHKIGKAPADFDQVLKVDLTNVPPEALAPGVELVAQLRGNDVQSRLKPGDQVQLRVNGTSELVTVTVAKELSCLVGPDFFAPPQP